MAGKPIATLGSMHVCPMVTGYVPHIGGPVSGPGAPNVLINGKPAALMGDMCVCTGPPDTIAQGEPTVLINGTPVATMGSMTAHGGSIVMGEPNVLISSATPNKKATMPLKKIPFPKITILDHVGAAMKGKRQELKEAQENQEMLKQDAQEQPEIIVSNLQWRQNMAKVEKAMIGQVVDLYAEIKGMEDGEYISLRIFEKDSVGEDNFVTSKSGSVQDGKVEIPWEVIYVEDKNDLESVQEMQDKGYTVPEFVFKFTNTDGETVESPMLEIEDCFEIKAINKETGEPLANVKYTISLPDGDFLTGQLDSNGYALVEQMLSSKEYPIVFYDDTKVYSARIQ